MNLRKTWVVATREYRTTVRTKAFVIAIVLMPVFMLGGITVQKFLEDRVDTETKKVAVLDRSGQMFEALAQEAEKRNAKATDEATGKPTRSHFELRRVPVTDEDLDARRLELSEQIKNDKLLAFIEIPPDILSRESKNAEAKVRYHSNQPTYDDVRRWLSAVISDRVHSVRLAAAGIDRDVVDRALAPVDVENLGLLEQTASGEIKPAREVTAATTIMVPLAMVMLMWIALIMTTQPMLNGVIEEKMQRIAEVLMGSVPPFELMMGKLIGYVGVALTLVAIYGIGGWAIANRMGQTELLSAPLVIWFVIFLALAILMFGSLFLAAGACVNDIREAQNLVLPIWILLMIPFFTLGTVLEYPSSPFAVGVSLFPPATPMLMVMRMGVPPGVPLWQPLVGVVGTLLTTLAFVWMASRIFRVGLLMQGKPPKITEIARWVVRG